MSEADDDWAKLKSKPAPAPNAKADADWRALQAKPAPLPAEATPPAAPSAGRSAAEGMLQGGSYGFGDELQGVIGALLRRDPAAMAMFGYPSPAEQGETNITGPNSFGDDYRMERDAARRDRKSAETANPEAYNASQILAAVLAPGPKPGKTVGSFVKAGAKAGGAYGLGASDADLTKGDVGGVATDTALGTGVGAGAGLLAGGLNKAVLRPLADKAAAWGQKAAERGRSLAEKPIDAAINSTRGALGGEVAAGSRALEVAEKAAADPSIAEELSRAAGDLLDDPASAALKERVIRSQLGGLAGRLPRIEKAQGAFDEAVEAGSQEARDAAYQALMDKSPMKRALWEITKRVGPTIVGSSVGGMLGGTAGAGVGGGLGLLTGAMSGAPGRIMKNAVSSPQFQRSAAQMGTRALEEVIPGAMEGLIAEQAGNPASMTREKLAPWAKFLEPDEEQQQ